MELFTTVEKTIRRRSDHALLTFRSGGPGLWELLPTVRESTEAYPTTHQLKQ